MFNLERTKIRFQSLHNMYLCGRCHKKHGEFPEHITVIIPTDVSPPDRQLCMHCVFDAQTHRSFSDNPVHYIGQYNPKCNWINYNRFGYMSRQLGFDIPAC